MRKSFPPSRSMGNGDVSTLESEHRSLKQRVSELDRRAFLTPAEQIESAELKRRKLAVKDTLMELRRTAGS